MSFGDIIRSAAAPTIAPKGIGGDVNTIWYSDGVGDVNNLFELDVNDFSVVRSSLLAANMKDIGGDANTIWTCVGPIDLVYELYSTDFSVKRNAASPSSRPMGMGGNAGVIWHSDTTSDRIYELSIIDLSTIRSAASPNGYPSGIGGDANTIWHIDRTANMLYELDTTDFSIIQSAGGYSTLIEGVGGDASVIWLCINGVTGVTSDLVCEIDTGVVSPAEYTTGRPSRRSTGATVSGGIGCGMGKRRR